MKSLLPKIVFFLLLQTGQSAMAQVKFSATISPGQINKDEYAQLRLVVENAREVQQIVPPALNNFIILSGPNQENGMSMVNGDVTKYIAVSFIIKPKAPGTYTIPSTLAKADGVTYRSNSVSIKVINASSGNNNNNAGGGFMSPFNGFDPFGEQPPETPNQDYILRKGENALDKIKKNMLVKVETDKTSCYVGEPIIATYKLYTRLKSESGMTKNPSFNGFSVIDLQQPDNTSYKTEKLNGKQYNVYTIRKAQLYPLQPGNLELESAEIDNNVHFIKEEYFKRQQDIMGDMFRDFADAAIPPEGVEDHKITLQSTPLTILVKPLPDANKPADFKGAVGNFDISATVTKNNFTTDDASELTVIISGAGNLQLVTAPEVSWPDGVEAFDPKLTDDLYKTTVPVSGRKIISYPFTVTKPGTYNLPAIVFSFFDSKTGQYRSVSTKPQNFTVTKGTGKHQDKVVANATADEPFLTKFFKNRWRVVSVVAILVILGLIFWLKREIKKDKQDKLSLANNEKTATAVEAAELVIIPQENPLAPASEHLQSNNGAAFYPVLNQSLRNYLSHKLQILPEDLNKKSISEKMDSKGVRNDITLQLQQLLDEIEWQLYTPFSPNEKMQEIYDRANGLIQLLNMYKA